MRHAWIGLGVLLGYWPDVFEWGLLLCGVRLPHAAPASLPAAAVSILVIVILLRFALRERSRLTLIAAAVMIASHTLLDGISGGIPAWWPFNCALVGPEWIDLDNLPMARRLRVETLFFLPTYAVGLAIFALRRKPAPLAAWLAVGLAAAALLSALFGSVIGVLVATTVLILAESVQIERFDWRWALNIVPMLPVVALGAVQIYAWRNINAGLAAIRSGDLEAALIHNREAARFRPVDLEATARYRVGECLLHLRRFGEAHDEFSRGRAEFPGHYMFLDGLAQVYLAADAPELRRPREALALAQQAQSRSPDPAYRRWIQQFIDQARATADER